MLVVTAAPGPAPVLLDVVLGLIESLDIALRSRRRWMVDGVITAHLYASGMTVVPEAITDMDVYTCTHDATTLHMPRVHSLDGFTLMDGTRAPVVVYEIPCRPVAKRVSSSMSLDAYKHRAALLLMNWVRPGAVVRCVASMCAAPPALDHRRGCMWLRLQTAVCDAAPMHCDHCTTPPPPPSSPWTVVHVALPDLCPDKTIAPPGSAARVFARNLLPPHDEDRDLVVAVLCAWFRVLAPGGWLHMCQPMQAGADLETATAEWTELGTTLTAIGFVHVRPWDWPDTDQDLGTAELAMTIEAQKPWE